MIPKLDPKILIGAALLTSSLIIGVAASKKTPEEPVFFKTSPPTTSQKEVLSDTERVAPPTPTPVRTPIPDPNPIVTCQFTYLPHRQMPLSDCQRVTECQLVQGGEWFLADSLTACRDAQSKLIAGMAAWDRANPPPAPPTYTGMPYIPPPTLDTSGLDQIMQRFQRELDYILSPDYVPSQKALEETAEHRRQLIDECKRDCETNALNLLDARIHYFGDQELSPSEYAAAKSRLEKQIGQCKALCEF